METKIKSTLLISLAIVLTAWILGSAFKKGMKI